MPHPPADQPRHRPGFRLLYSLLSALIPGTGQVLAGRRWRGGVMLAVSLVIIAGVLIAYGQGPNRLLSYAVQPRVLIGVFVLNLAVLAFRFGSVMDAYWSPAPESEPEDGRRPPGWRGGLVALALVGVLGFTAAPHAVLGYYTYLTYDTLNQVFSMESIADELEEEQNSSTADPTPIPSPTPDSAPDADVSGDDGISRRGTSRVAWAGAPPSGELTTVRGAPGPPLPGPYP